jgi:molybdopterin-guanine dinucleotide biosynthesis protein A
MLSSEMIKLDGMLMIGSAGANIGKTELACALIKKFNKNKDIIGIKVTTIKERDGQCPRGGQGCGVCSSLEGSFCITQETDADSGKDTARLLAAGAAKVFWLRVMKTHLKEGLADLLDKIGPDAVSLCESNSLRQVVKPGLFLMVRGKEPRMWKSSADAVKKYADKVVVSDGSSFDFDIGRIKLLGGKWVMQEQATAIIMAGGDSRRMGMDKSVLAINGKPMVEIIAEQLRASFSQTLISANDAEKFAFLGLQIVPDRIQGQGPLMGIASALEASANEVNFVVACDIPHIDLAYVRKMLFRAKGADIVIPRSRDKEYEPLFAVYNKSALEAINKVLRTGGRKISDVFTRCKVSYIELKADSFTNLNTRAEYEEFCKKYGT